MQIVKLKCMESKIQTRKIILDCDPGHDDAVAIMMAANHPSIELLGVSVVAGNQTIEKTTENALKTLQAIDKDIAVYKGCSEPLVREKAVIADDIHGETGLDGPKFDKLDRREEEIHAVDYLMDTLLNAKEPITLVATGPLTNLALAMKKQPAIKEHIREIVLMGGAYQLGNVTPAAEFNIFADPEAAQIVFASGLEVVMMGLDVTRKVLCYPKIIERMRKLNNKASKLFADLMEFFGKTQKQVFGWEGGPLHDPTCIAYLIDPSVVELKKMYSYIELRSESCYGRTMCDYFGVTKKQPNVKVAVDIDVEKFWTIVERCLKNYG